MFVCLFVCLGVYNIYIYIYRSEPVVDAFIHPELAKIHAEVDSKAVFVIQRSQVGDFSYAAHFYSLLMLSTDDRTPIQSYIPRIRRYDDLPTRLTRASHWMCTGSCMSMRGLLEKN